MQFLGVPATSCKEQRECQSQDSAAGRIERLLSFLHDEPHRSHHREDMQTRQGRILGNIRTGIQRQLGSGDLATESRYRRYGSEKRMNSLEPWLSATDGFAVQVSEYENSIPVPVCVRPPLFGLTSPKRQVQTLRGELEAAVGHTEPPGR